MQQLSRYWQSRLWIVVGLLALGSASAEEGSEAVDTADNQMAEERGYFFGYSFGNMLQQGGNPDVDLAALMQGLKDSLAASPPALDSAAQTAVMAIVRERQQSVQAEQQALAENQAERNLAAGAAYLAENSEREGVEVTASRLEVLADDMDTGVIDFGSSEGERSQRNQNPTMLSINAAGIARSQMRRFF